jgi:hypothetical protein
MDYNIDYLRLLFDSLRFVDFIRHTLERLLLMQL